MPVATLRDEATQRARDFAWDQWSQMGVSGAPPGTPERRAADPEALLLFTLEVGRHDPRLFDEVLDWLVLNEHLISVQRLRNLCVDAVDRSLVDAALTWVARWRPRARLSSRSTAIDRDEAPRPLFVGLSVPVGRLEPAFEAQGWLRPEFQPSKKSQRPDLHAPINLALRLRRLLGIGARAEVVRALLTIDAPRISAGVLHASAGFTRQNVRESLQQLQDAVVVTASRVGGDELYALRPFDWARLLDLDEGKIPQHHEWIQILGPLRLILRWLNHDDLEALSEYMRASEARVLLNQLESDLGFAGLAADGQSAKGAEFWNEFVRTVEALLGDL